MPQKFCPLMSRMAGHPSQDKYGSPTMEYNFEPVNCQESKCALWIGVTSTEGYSHQCCAFEMIALKNSEGQYRV